MWLRQVDFYVVTLLHWTAMFELSMARLALKKGYQNGVCYDEIEFNTYVLKTTIIGLIGKTMWSPYVIT